MTVMRVLLFVLHMCMLRECEGDGNAGLGAGGGVVAVSVGCEYMGGTRGSGFVSTAEDVLEMNVVRRVRGVGGVCEVCMYLDWDGVQWVRGFGLGFTNPEKWETCVCVWAAVVLGGGGVSRWLCPGSERMGVVMYVCCESGFFVEMAGPCIRVLCSADSCAP